MHSYIQHNICIYTHIRICNIHTRNHVNSSQSFWWSFHQKTHKNPWKSHLESQLYHPTWALNLQSFHPREGKRPALVHLVEEQGLPKEPHQGFKVMDKPWKSNMDQETYWFPYLNSRSVWCIGPGFHYLKLHYHHLFIKVLKILKCSCDHLFRTSMVDCAAVAGGVKIRFSSTACGIHDICLKGLQVRVSL